MLRFFLIFFFFVNSVIAKELVIKDAEKKFDLQTYKGKIIIINFWASWCTNCLAEMEDLKNLYQKYHSQGLEIIGLSIDDKRSRNNFRRVAEKLNYPNFMFIDAVKTDFTEPNSIPLNYLIDKTGNMLQIDDIKDLEKTIAKLFSA